MDARRSGVLRIMAGVVSSLYIIYVANKKHELLKNSSNIDEENHRDCTIVIFSDRYGGVHSLEECDQLPTEIRQGYVDKIL